MWLVKDCVAVLVESARRAGAGADRVTGCAGGSEARAPAAVLRDAEPIRSLTSLRRALADRAERGEGVGHFLPRSAFGALPFVIDHLSDASHQ